MHGSPIDKYVDEIKELFYCDISIKDIASDFGINPRTLQSYIRRNPDIFVKKRRRYRHLTDDESKKIYQAWLANKTPISIAKAMNISESTVRRHIYMNLHKKV